MKNSKENKLIYYDDFHGDKNVQKPVDGNGKIVGWKIWQ